ncbi:hypothetical protein Tco_1054241 [Tanacetum coccineum]|uniref:Uncharacterized protein n=1 Tax=Tanacetum coccineum TaxID=301880 RepID=A0ABQ5GWM9_9ASTR
MEQMTSICDMVGQLIQKKEEEKRIEEEQAAKDRYWKIPVCYDDDDDEESSIPLKDIISELPPCVAITPDSPKTNSLIMEDEHLDTFETDRTINKLNHDLTFSNPLFDIDEDFTSSDESFSEEDVPNENFKIFSITSLILMRNHFTKGDTLFLESLLYDNSFPRPPEEFNSENPTASFSPSPIPIEDSDSLIEEIDIFLDDDDSIPPGIESDDFDSEDDDNSTSQSEFRSFHVDYPDSGDSTIDVVEDIPVDVPNILPTHLALQLDFDFIPSNDLGSDLNDSSPFGDSTRFNNAEEGICIEDKVFNHGVLASKEKSPSSSSHRGFKASKDFSDCDDFRARVVVLTYGYQEKDKNKDKSGQNQARDWKERENTNPTTSGAYDHEAGSSRAKRSRNVETVEEALLPDVHHEFLEWRGCSREAKSRYNSRLATLLPKLIYSPQIVDWQLLHKIGCGDKIDQILSTQNFAVSSMLLRIEEWRLGLYHVDELEEKGFDTYFQGGLRSGENFNAREYWERISLYRDLHLSMSSITSVRFSILKVLHKMITYGLCQRTTRYEKIQRNDMWLLSVFEYRHQNGYANVAWVIVKWMKRKGAGSQKDNQICYGQFISKISRTSRVLTEEIIRSLSTPVYCRDLDRTTLRELIDSEDSIDS